MPYRARYIWAITSSATVLGPLQNNHKGRRYLGVPSAFRNSTRTTNPSNCGRPLKWRWVQALSLAVVPPSVTWVCCSGSGGVFKANLVLQRDFRLLRDFGYDYEISP